MKKPEEIIYLRDSGFHPPEPEKGDLEEFLGDSSQEFTFRGKLQKGGNFRKLPKRAKPAGMLGAGTLQNNRQYDNNHHNEFGAGGDFIIEDEQVKKNEVEKGGELIHTLEDRSINTLFIKKKGTKDLVSYKSIKTLLESDYDEFNHPANLHLAELHGVDSYSNLLEGK